MPTLTLELSIRHDSGPVLIAGIDEAGRGAIAGPVVAAAVILPLDQPQVISRLAAVDDSKKLAARLRETLFDLIIDTAVSYGIGQVSADDIDRIGIIPANALAMCRAVDQLDPPAGYLLLDGRMRLRNLPLPQQSIIRGDSISLSIAAASILAKVSRDRQMTELDRLFPQYRFAQHKGYCTPGHVTRLLQYGPCDIHRHSFAPIRRPLI